MSRSPGDQSLLARLASLGVPAEAAPDLARALAERLAALETVPVAVLEAVTPAIGFRPRRPGASDDGD